MTCLNSIVESSGQHNWKPNGSHLEGVKLIKKKGSDSDLNMRELIYGIKVT